MKPTETAKLAAEIAEKLNALKPEEADKVLRVVEELRETPSAPKRKTDAPNFAPPSEPPKRQRIEDIFRSLPSPQLQTYH